MKAIELKNVCFGYEENNLILNDVNFSADYGEIVLIAGHSGQGKSTLLSLISGIIPYINGGMLSGKVIIDGQINTKNKVGFVIQNADAQILHKTNEDEIAFGLENIGVEPNKIERQIDIVCDIMKLDKNDFSRSLSGGQKQRLITASVLAMGRKILLLDEPLANLDKQSTEILMSTLKNLANAGYSVIIVEHRLDMVISYVDSVWHIENKNIFKVEDKNKYLISQTKQTEDNNGDITTNEILFYLRNVGYSVKENGKKKVILENINLDIFKGERLLILGENGSGKTSLLRLLAKLSKKTSGIMVNSFCIDKANKKWFKKVGFVYQNPDYQLFMPTVEKEIYFGAQSKEYAEEIIKMFNLDYIRTRHPASLSEGQKRRVSIAAVMAGKPEVLLLDEPTVGQDYQGLCELSDILNKIHTETQNTMITITHDKRIAKSICDRVIIINNHNIEKIGHKNLVDKFFND